MTLGVFFRSAGNRRSRALFLAGLVLSRLLHEFGIALVLLPLIHALMLDPSDVKRRRLLTLFWTAAAVGAALELVLFVVADVSVSRLFVTVTSAAAFRPVRLPPFPPLHLFEAGSPLSVFAVVVIPLALLAAVLGRRTGAWFVTATCALLGMCFQLGALIAFTAVAIIARPGRTSALHGDRPRRISRIGSALDRSYGRHDVDAPVLAAAGDARRRRAALPALRFHTLASGHPAIAAAALAGLLWIVHDSRRGDASSDALRAAGVFSIVILVTFGVLGVGVQPRFLLLACSVLAFPGAYRHRQDFRVGVEIRPEPRVTRSEACSAGDDDCAACGTCILPARVQ